MEAEVRKALGLVKERLKEASEYLDIGRVLEYDQMTVCPKAGQEDQGNLIVSMQNRCYRIRKEAAFREAVLLLNAHLGKLEEWDQCMVRSQYRSLIREEEITVEKEKQYSAVQAKAWLAWSSARDLNDFDLFEEALARLRDSEIEKVGWWRYAADEYVPVTPYEKMLGLYERGLTKEKLDKLFSQSRDRISALLARIQKCKAEVRTDFLYRPVEGFQQQAMTECLLDLLRFDKMRGSSGESEHPFTSRLGRDDTRVTTHYYPGEFMSAIYSIIHECGHALFEQMQPQRNFDHFLADEKTLGMHESVSRFYENILGRSEAFIHLIYPLICEIFPQVFYDVTEEELYRAVNLVTPSLIRTEADELTYTMHIIIRYELEKELVEERLDTKKLRMRWKELYREYLGVEPADDRHGILQDVHWASGFGYFPTYALGNYYGAMYYRRMREELDIDRLVAEGDFGTINLWMQEHVFIRADRLDSTEWIREITGRELTAEDYLDYLTEKYERLYPLEDDTPKEDANQNTRRVLLRVAYDGSIYHGWQAQENAVSVEGILNAVLTELLGEEIRVVGGSRTDAGVHALDNVAVFDTRSRIPAEKLPYALNRRLPEEIRVLSGRKVAGDFHPRHCESRKTYEYHILSSPLAIPQKRHYAFWTYRRPDVARMAEAGKYLLGEHDFTSFCSVHAQSETRVRHIYELTVEEQAVPMPRSSFEGLKGEGKASEIVIRVTGNGFLYNMVRIIAGTLLEVGYGNIEPQEMTQILEEKDRRAAGPTAPPEGLTLAEYRFLS